MTDADQRAFAAVMATLSETYQREVSPAQMGTYFHALRDRTIDEVQRAVETLIKTSKWLLPKPAEIRESITRHQLATRDTRGPMPEPVALLPGEVERRRQQERSDPVVKASVAMQQAWQERCEAVKNGLPAADADVVIAQLWRELMPRGRELDWTHRCGDCRDSGLVRFEQAGYTMHRPCTCPAGERWRPLAEVIDAGRSRVARSAA